MLIETTDNIDASLKTVKPQNAEHRLNIFNCTHMVFFLIIVLLMAMVYCHLPFLYPRVIPLLHILSILRMVKNRYHTELMKFVIASFQCAAKIRLTTDNPDTTNRHNLSLGEALYYCPADVDFRTTQSAEGPAFPYVNNPFIFDFLTRMQQSISHLASVLLVIQGQDVQCKNWCKLGHATHSILIKKHC